MAVMVDIQKIRDSTVSDVKWTVEITFSAKPEHFFPSTLSTTYIQLTSYPVETRKSFVRIKQLKRVADYSLSSSNIIGIGAFSPLLHTS